MDVPERGKPETIVILSLINWIQWGAG